MRYLSKDERGGKRSCWAKVCMALVEGLSAMTVRRIAAEAGVATGHSPPPFAFRWPGLKSLAFVRLIRELL